MTMSREKKINRAIWLMEQYPEVFASSWKDFFNYCPKGDFSYNDDEGGDWIPVNEDRENWSKYRHAVYLSRENGVEMIDFCSIDCDGDSDPFGCYEGEPKTEIDIYQFSLDSLTFNCYYALLHIAAYNEWCYRHAEDPLGNYYLSRVDKPVRFMVEYKEDEEGFHATRSMMKGGQVADGLFGLPEDLRYMFDNEVPKSSKEYYIAYKAVLEGGSCDLSCGGPNKITLIAKGNGKGIIFAEGTIAKELAEKKQRIEIRKIANRNLTKDVNEYYRFVVDELKKAGIKI